jgi:phosphomannomutase
MKKVLAFDLDDTLAITKSPISDEMSEVLRQVLEFYDVCVISGGKYEQFQKQVVTRLNVDEDKLARLHLMPACGTQYYRYDIDKHEWALQYSEGLTEDQKVKIREVLESSARQLGYWPENPAGEVIEDRISQLTYAGLGQDATPEDKYAWDPDNKKRLAIREIAQPQIPELEIRLGGTTSIDVTKKGIDKAYGMRKLIEAVGITKEDILFFGDKLQEGGNDYPVKAFGIDSIEVQNWEDTIVKLREILAEIR